MTDSPGTTAPDALLEALRSVHEALDSVTERDDLGRIVGWSPADAMSAEQLAETVRLGAELEGRLQGLRLHCVNAAETTGAVAARADADAGAWAARAGKNRTRSWGGLWLAKRLEAAYPATRAALAQGRISEDHAAVIVRCCDRIPDHVRDALSDGDLAGCEEQLVAKAGAMSPPNLRRAARRFLDPLSKQYADAHEEADLLDAEHHAQVETWLTLGPNGDGTWSGKFVIPDLHAAILKKALDVLATPRRTPGSKADVTEHTWNYTERLGRAFCEVLEHLPETGHARSGIHLVVHLDEAQLKDAVGGCVTDTGTTLSTQDVRRLACDAGLIPFVLRGKSVPLDLGTQQRLFSRAQVIALSAAYDTCAADGCDRPFAWTEIHHHTPWSHGGPTDLNNAVPLCAHHHRAIHDPSYEHHRQPDGTITYEHRRRRARPQTRAA